MPRLSIRLLGSREAEGRRRSPLTVPARDNLPLREIGRWTGCNPVKIPLARYNLLSTGACAAEPSPRPGASSRPTPKKEPTLLKLMAHALMHCDFHTQLPPTQQIAILIKAGHVLPCPCNHHGILHRKIPSELVKDTRSQGSKQSLGDRSDGFHGVP